MHFSKKIFFLASFALFLVLLLVAARRIATCYETQQTKRLQAQSSRLRKAAALLQANKTTKVLKSTIQHRFFPNIEDKAAEKVSKTLSDFGYSPAFSKFFNQKQEKIVLYKWISSLSDGESVLLVKRDGLLRPILLVKKAAQLRILFDTRFELNFEKVARGLIIELVVIFGTSFIVLIILAFLLVGGLRRSNKELSQELKELKYVEPFTGAYNTLYFHRVMATEVARSTRYQIPFSLVMFDIDGLKMINDFFGRDGGDAAIKKCTSFVADAIRDVDLLFYLGDGGFALILPNTELSGAFILTERLRTLLEARSFAWKDKEMAVCASFGVTSLKLEHDSCDDLIGRAEQLLQKAKQTGRNRVC